MNTYSKHSNNEEDRDKEISINTGSLIYKIRNQAVARDKRFKYSGGKIGEHHRRFVYSSLIISYIIIIATAVEIHSSMFRLVHH